MNNIEDTITAVERLFHRVTGQQVPAGQVKHSIQPNVDPISLLERRVGELVHMVQDPFVWRHLQPWTPPMSVWENDEKILIRLDLPAVSKEEVDISLRGTMLVVNGTRQALPQIAGFMPRHSETAFGQFQRIINLPLENMTPEISSSIKDGVLEISITKQSQDRNNPKKAGNGKMQ